jgi:hypothetical protein
MPKTKAMVHRPPTNTRLQGKSSSCMGAPPPVLGKPGKPAKLAKAVAVNSEELGWLVDLAFGLAVALGAGAVRQFESVMALESNDTAPVCANARPARLAPVCRLTDVDARIFPTNQFLYR